jgi:hypothetical protein
MSVVLIGYMLHESAKICTFWFLLQHTRMLGLWITLSLAASRLTSSVLSVDGISL